MPGQNQVPQPEVDVRELEAEIQQLHLQQQQQAPEEAQQNHRLPYYVSVDGRNLNFYIEGYFDWAKQKWHQWIRGDGKSLGLLVSGTLMESCYGKNWWRQFEELRDLKGKSPRQIFRETGIDQPTEYIIPKPMLMETWISALKKDKRDAEDSEGPNSDVAFARRMQANDRLIPMSDAGWLDKRSIQRTIDKTLHSDWTNGVILNWNLARLAKYRLKKEHAVGNYIFGKWKRDRYQRKEAALTKILEANYIQRQEGKTFDVIIKRENTLIKLSRLTGSDAQSLNSREVKRLKLKQ